MKEERRDAEKKVWQTIAKVAQESGKESAWEYLGYSCSAKKINDLVVKFHQDFRHPGFYGLRIPVGEVEGMKVNMIIENQQELIIGVQLEQSDVVHEEQAAYASYREIFNALADSSHDWNLDSPGWLAWKTPEVKLDFRAANNRAFQDILMNSDNSEALYLITEEVSDLLEEISELVINQQVMEYGTVAN